MALARRKSVVIERYHSFANRKIHPTVTLPGYLDAFTPKQYDCAMQATETNFLAELERVVRGERPTVDPRALLFVAAEVILAGRKADEQDLQRTPSGRLPNNNVIAFPKR
jgi:hypothetical protein